MRRSALPDRVLYIPEKDGKPSWRPTRLEATAFSRPEPDGVWLRKQEEARVGALMLRFGLGPGGTGEMQDAASAGLEGEVD
jgi:hypothetical protein